MRIDIVKPFCFETMAKDIKQVTGTTLTVPTIAIALGALQSPTHFVWDSENKTLFVANSDSDERLAVAVSGVVQQDFIFNPKEVFKPHMFWTPKYEVRAKRGPWF